jgi:hypothetical protein
MTDTCSKHCACRIQILSKEVFQKGPLENLAVYAYGFAVVVRVPE